MRLSKLELRPPIGSLRRVVEGVKGIAPLRRFLRFKWWPVPVALILVAVVAIVVLSSRRGGGQTDGSYQTYTVRRGNIIATVASTGEVYAPRQAELSFDVTKVALIELNVSPGQQVKAGDVLARIDPTSLERAVTQAQAELTVAQDNLDVAKAPYTELDLAKAKLTVEQAKVALAEAQENLDEVLHPDVEAAQLALQEAAANLQSAQSQLVAAQADTGSAAKIRTLEYEAKWYENNYYAAQVKFEQGKIDQQKLDWEYSNMLAAQEKLQVAKAQAEAELLSAQNAVAKAQEAYNEAQENLKKAQAGPSETEAAAARNKVAEAEYNLAKAQDDLAKIEAGPDSQDVQVAEAKVVSAQAALEEAQAALEAATMTAPFDGTIISVGAEVGDLVSSGTVVITMADLTELRAMAIIDEADIAGIEVGQEATITFDALPGVSFQGKVLEVPLQGTLSSNVLTYQVPVSLEGVEQLDGTSLKPGMTANVTISLGNAQNVLLVPALAVQQSDTGYVVLVQDNPRQAAVETPVQLGLSDGTYVEVKKGLNEGDRVVYQYESTEEDEFGQMPGGPGGQGQMMPPSGGAGMMR